MFVFFIELESKFGKTFRCFYGAAIICLNTLYFAFFACSCFMGSVSYLHRRPLLLSLQVPPLVAEEEQIRVEYS